LHTKPAYAYVSSEVGHAFDQYTRACGLSSKSELLKLLIQRELRLQRLQAAAQARQSPTAGRTKITAHLDDSLDAALAAHALSLGVSTSHAAASLVETELSERWLEAALEWVPSR